MELEQIAKIAQKCIQSHPVVVLGSGASVPHKITGMKELAEQLIQNIETNGAEEVDAWVLVRTALAAGDGLEEALQNVSIPPSLVKKIVTLTWEIIAKDDLALLQRVIERVEKIPLVSLINSLFRSTNQTVDIVTPNYDRIVEYAADMAQYTHNTGFAPGIIRSKEGVEEILVRRGKAPARTVRIWKVHGSLDWFESKSGEVISLPLTGKLPKGFAPLIVTPGVSKFERTHDEPFRSLIHGADTALNRAKAFLCIGYGFRDSHIQPKLVERCRSRNVPIVILARTLTDEAKNFIKNSAGDSFLALEHCTTGTKVFSNEKPAGEILRGKKLWSFEEFNKIAF